MGDSELVQIDLAYFLTLAGRFEEALAILDPLARNRPLDPILLLNLGIARSGAGHYETADRVLRNAAELQPDLAETHLVLGNVRIHMGDRNGAAESFREYLRLEPEGRETFRIREILRRLDGGERTVSGQANRPEVR